MRRGTIEILTTLRASHPKRVLIDLWADLHAISKEQFENAIEGPPKPKAAKKKRNQPTARVAPDRPASRIAQLMLEKCALSPPSAVQALRAQLATQGIADSRIPTLQGTDLEAWLSKLFKTVPASHVLHAAVALSDRART
jgi:hypothetical protein